jgi:hypothetical protein
MESWKRKLRMGMVGGGQGAFIGGVHRIAATLDQQVEVVAGCFSQSYDNTKLTGAQLYLDPAKRGERPCAQIRCRLGQRARLGRVKALVAQQTG